MRLRRIIAIAICAFLYPVLAQAQFKEQAFTQSYVDENDSTAFKDSTDKLFSFKEYFGALGHKNTMKIGNMFAGSVVLPGTAQIYNRQYWKLPIIYGGLAAFAGSGGYYLGRYQKTVKAEAAWQADRSAFLEANPGLSYDVPQPLLDTRSKTMGTWLMVGAGVVYWASLMDGVASYKSDQSPLPGRATLYSILLPGLGQAYNGEYWKIPVYYTGLMISGYCLYNFNLNYRRFKNIHNMATDPNQEYDGSISGETAKYYRDVYRRYRDYSIVATVAVYLLQVIDANVFAYMHDFEVNDNLTLDISPTIINPDNCYAFNPSQSAVGLSLGLRF